jgi:hypothetical protein
MKPFSVSQLAQRCAPLDVHASPVAAVPLSHVHENGCDVFSFEMSSIAVLRCDWTSAASSLTMIVNKQAANAAMRSIIVVFFMMLIRRLH